MDGFLSIVGFTHIGRAFEPAPRVVPMLFVVAGFTGRGKTVRKSVFKKESE